MLTRLAITDVRKNYPDDPPADVIHATYRPFTQFYRGVDGQNPANAHMYETNMQNWFGTCSCQSYKHMV